MDVYAKSRGDLRTFVGTPPVILRRHEVRRVLTERFPYRIFFSLKGDAVVVHAVLYGHRDDRYWKDRL